MYTVIRAPLQRRNFQRLNRRPQPSSLVVRASRDDLLASGPEEDGVLELGRVAPLDVTQRGIGFDDLLVAQVLEGHEVLLLSEPVEPAPAEGQRAEVLVDRVQELLRPAQPQGDVADVEILHVVGTLHVIVNNATSSGSKGFCEGKKCQGLVKLSLRQKQGFFSAYR